MPLLFSTTATDLGRHAWRWSHPPLSSLPPDRTAVEAYLHIRAARVEELEASLHIRVVRRGDDTGGGARGLPARARRASEADEAGVGSAQRSAAAVAGGLIRRITPTQSIVYYSTKYELKQPHVCFSYVQGKVSA